jgi:DNA-directed RNA polymerase specialized sigma24 family protein
MPRATVGEESEWRLLGARDETLDSRRHDHRQRLDQLAALKPDQRIALLLHAAGYSYAEISELRGWTHTKVNRSLAEGRAALRQMEGGEN